MALSYVTTQLAKWGAGLARPLHASEADENFWDLDSRLVNIEENPPIADAISNIEVVGTQMKIYTTGGAQFGPFTLPVARFNARGYWVAGGMPYYEMDLVSVKGQGLYLILKDHVSAATFDPLATDGTGNKLYLLVFADDALIYDFGFFYPGKPGQGVAVGEPMAEHLFARDVYLLDNAPGAVAKLKIATTASMVLALTKNGTQIGTVTFAAGAVLGVIAMTQTQFNAADIFGVTRPAGVDLTASGVVMTFPGTRGLVA